MSSATLSQLFRFGVTGFLVAVIYVALHAVLAPVGLSPLVANAIAFSSAVAFQFVVQTVWTFRRDLHNAAQAFRFLTVVLLGLGYSSLMTGYVGPLFGYSTVLTAGFVAVTMPALNYLAFRFWVFP